MSDARRRKPATVRTYGAEARAAHGLLHRHVALHRLQGLRGRLQGVEPRPGRRSRASPATPTTTRARSAPTRGATSRSSSSAAGRRRRRSPTLVQTAALSASPTSRPPDLPGGRRPALADGLRRLQALHARRVPRRLPDRRAVPHRVRHGRRAGGRLQRLRLLRPGVPVRRARPARGATAAPGSARSATTASRTTGARRARRPARRTRSSSASSTTSATRAEERLADAHGGRPGGRPPVPRRRATTASAASGAFFLLLDEPEVYGLPPDPVATTRDLGSVWAAAGAAAVGARRGHRGGGARGRGAMSAERRDGRAGRAASYYGRPVHQAAGLDARRSRSTSSPAAWPAPRPGSRSPPDCGGNDELARRAWLIAAGAASARARRC